MHDANEDATLIPQGEIDSVIAALQGLLPDSITAWMFYDEEGKLVSMK